LRLDERLLNEQHRLAARDLVGHGVDDPVGHVLQHHRLQRECGGPTPHGTLNQRAALERLHSLQHRGT